MYATALEQHLREHSPNVLIYTPLLVDDKFVFIMNRLLRTLSGMVEGGEVEVLHVEICPETQIPTVHLMLPFWLKEQDVASLFDETQRLFQKAAKRA
ncbi:hypothetical protein [Pseudoalteromonas sp. T1lg10]|uniref:hypothetical protein n=1 Tax=Pseudoalteromonas sp. T1lg10 TaxID=2077093 RepID=UPI000CF6B5EC|nr:hypothetical protein [Pseudoalteromonas sp. T1lg10]